MSAARRKQQERVCEGCGCTDANACIDEKTGEPCAWVKGYDGDLCTACARVAVAVAYAGEDEEEFPDPGDEHFAGPDNMVEVFSEADANRAIAELRGAR